MQIHNMCIQTFSIPIRFVFCSSPLFPLTRFLWDRMSWSFFALWLPVGFGQWET